MSILIQQFDENEMLGCPILRQRKLWDINISISQIKLFSGATVVPKMQEQHIDELEDTFKFKCRRMETSCNLSASPQPWTWNWHKDSKGWCGVLWCGPFIFHVWKLGLGIPALSLLSPGEITSIHESLGDLEVTPHPHTAQKWRSKTPV